MHRRGSAPQGLLGTGQPVAAGTVRIGSGSASDVVRLADFVFGIARTLLAVVVLGTGGIFAERVERCQVVDLVGPGHHRQLVDVGIP